MKRLRKQYWLPHGRGVGWRERKQSEMKTKTNQTSGDGGDELPVGTQPDLWSDRGRGLLDQSGGGTHSEMVNNEKENPPTRPPEAIYNILKYLAIVHRY